MGSLIYDESTQAFKESATPLVHSGGVWQNSEGKVYNGSEWVDAWSAVDLVSWADGTDAEIAALISYIDANNLTLADVGWQVGDERTVTLNGIETVTFVVEDIDNYTSGGTHYHAAVGQKNGLSTLRQMNSTSTNSGGYNATNVMKPYVEGTYQTALQNATAGNFWSSVISAVHKSQIYPSGLQSTTAKVILHSICETHSASSYCPDETTANGFHQFNYYQTQANRVKKQGDSGSANSYWERSADANYNGYFWLPLASGSATSQGASHSYLVAPFCVI